MEPKLCKEDIQAIVDESISSRISNQQVTISFNIEEPYAEKRLKNNAECR